MDKHDKILHETIAILDTELYKYNVKLQRYYLGMDDELNFLQLFNIKYVLVKDITDNDVKKHYLNQISEALSEIVNVDNALETGLPYSKYIIDYFIDMIKYIHENIIHHVFVQVFPNHYCRLKLINNSKNKSTIYKIRIISAIKNKD